MGGTFGLNDYYSFSAEYWSVVSYIPTQSKQYQVDYSDGDILFHSADASKSISISYEGRGSLVKADDINQIVDLLNSGDWVSEQIPNLAALIVVDDGDVITDDDEIVYAD